MNSTAIISALGTGCTTQGVTKYIAEHDQDREKQNRLISTALAITLVSSLVLTVLILVFYRQLGNYIFKTGEYNQAVVFFGLTLVLFSMNLTLISIINGFRAFRQYVIINILSSALSLALTIPVVYYFGVIGALVSYVLSQALIIFITLYFIRKEGWVSALRQSWKADRAIVRVLAGFTLMSLVSSLLGPYVQLFIRGYIISHISDHAAGIWEGINRLSAMYLSLITTSISIYYLPKLSGIKEPQLLRSEILKTCKIVLPPLALFCGLLYLGRDLVIRLVFTREFLPMRDLFAVQLLGDFLKIASWLLAFVFWAKAMTRAFIATELVFASTLALFSYYFINEYGFHGTVYGYALNYFLYLITVCIILRKLLVYGK
jgi:PST family polysaccharide transporter